MKTITNDRQYQAISKRIGELLEIVTNDNYNSIYRISVRQGTYSKSCPDNMRKIEY